MVLYAHVAGASTDCDSAGLDMGASISIIPLVGKPTERSYCFVASGH